MKRVVIISPSDVQPERDLIAAALMKMSQDSMREDGENIDVWRYEVDADRVYDPRGIQAGIDVQMDMTTVDVAIAILWKRIGSGNLEHEIRKAQENHPRTQLVVLRKITPLPPKLDREAGRQLQGVNELCEDYSGLVTEFESDDQLELRLRDLKRVILPPSGVRVELAKQFNPGLYRSIFGVMPRWQAFDRPATATKPDAKLDEMYQELRIGRSPSDDQAQPILPDEIAARPGRRLLLEGPAGCGKTTWVDHRFQALLARPDVLPFHIELRALRDTQIIRHLELLLDESNCPSEGLANALSAEDGPLPVLLIDGWDELGTSGDDFRRKLIGFLNVHKRVTAIVTSRPQADSKPTHDNFEHRFVQELSVQEQEKFAARYWRMCYGDDPRRESLDRGFRESLDNSPEARVLAGRPLLLTMMLAIGDSQPLPDRRHRLYEKCIDHLLKRREPSPDEWRPEDENDRLRAVTHLAFWMQSRRKDRGKEIAVSATEMLAGLPESWPPAQRERFLPWLLKKAGLLVDRADNTLQFSHLSFQPTFPF